MKKLFLITVILLLQSFPSFGNPNGKGIICSLIEGVVYRHIDKEQTIDSELGFGFKGDKVSMTYFNLNEDTDIVFILSTTKKNFTTTKRKIKWGKFVLDRKSLILNIKHSKGGSTFQCKVYTFVDHLLNMEHLKNKYQKVFDQKFKKLENKI